MMISRRALLAGAAAGLAGLAAGLAPARAAGKPTITVYKDPT